MSKFHRMASPQLWKITGYNAVPWNKKPGVKPKDQIKNWSIFKGDTVALRSGAKKDLGKTGKVIDIDKEKNLVYVEGLKLVSKKIPKTIDQDNNQGFISLETGIHYSNVALIDPETKKPTRIYWEDKELEDGRIVKVRKSVKSHQEIPRPIFDPSVLKKKRKENNPCDTMLEDAHAVTYTPSLAVPPLPKDLRLNNHGNW